jgi:hypothetical protein
MEQWKVKTSRGYARTYSKWEGAKRDYGMICNRMENDLNDDTPDWVKMFHRNDIDEKWRIMEEFVLEEEDDDEDEDEYDE